MMIVLLIVSVVAAATIPVMTSKRAGDSTTDLSSPWKYGFGSDASGIYFKNDASPDAMVSIGSLTNSSPLTYKNPALLINSRTPKDITKSSQIRFVKSGKDAGRLALDEKQNIALGYNAMESTGTSPTTFTDNIAIGNSAFLNPGYSDNSIAIGKNALDSNKGNFNIGIGFNAVNANDASGNATNGSYNIGIGGSSLLANDGGDGNIGLGWSTLRSNSGYGNIGIGGNTLLGNKGYQNIGLGDGALSGNVGYHNISLGYMALANGNGHANIGLGPNALEGNNGISNIGIGGSTLYGNIGKENVGLGIRVLVRNRGDRNMGLGFDALYGNSGNYNTGFGSNALYGNSGSYNVGLGWNALNSNKGSFNTGLGNGACVSLTGSKKTCIGYNSFRIGSYGGFNSSTDADNILIGAGSGGTVTFDVNTIYQKSSSIHTSDIRRKNITGVAKTSLDDIRKIKTYEFTYKTDVEKTPQIGVIAQEIKKIFPKSVKLGEDKYYFLNPDWVLYPLLRAVQELDKIVQSNFKEFKFLVTRVVLLENKTKTQDLEIKELRKELSSVHREMQYIKSQK